MNTRTETDLSKLAEFLRERATKFQMPQGVHVSPVPHGEMALMLIRTNTDAQYRPRDGGEA